MGLLVVGMKTEAKHILLDIWKPKNINLDSPRDLIKLCKDIAEASKCKVLRVSSFHFMPYGVSVVVLIAESHVSVHTYPEHDYLAIDIFTCGETDPELGSKYALSFLDPVHYNKQVINRGVK